MEKLRDDTITCIRSCVVSAKGQTLEMRELARDYVSLMGNGIPYQKLGYTSLEEFLSSVDTLIVRRERTGQVLVTGVPNPLSAGIGLMVNKQKPSKKKKTTYPIRSITQHPNQFKAPQRWQSRPTPTTPRPEYSYAVSPRVAQHNQYVSTPWKPAALRQYNNNNQHYNNNIARSNTTTSISQHNKENFNNKAHSPPAVPPTSAAPIKKSPTTTTSTPSQPLNSANVKPVQNAIQRVHINGDSPQPAKDKLPHSERTNRSKILSRMNSSPTNSADSGTQGMDVDAHPCNYSSCSSDDTSSIRERKDVFVISGDAGKDLWNYTRFRRIDEPEVSVLLRKTKLNRPMQFDCKIKVDGWTVSSYPEDFSDEQSAITHASKAALAKLLKKYGWKRNQAQIISSEEDLQERVPPLVGKHFNGVWSWQVEADYKDLYLESVPTDWLTLIDKSPTMSVEQFGNKFLLRVCNPEDKGKAHAALACDVSIPTSSVQFNEEGLLMAKITYPVSAGEIWCRQIYTDQSTVYDKMSLNMDKFYSEQYENKTAGPSAKIVKGHYYSAFKDGHWYRVKVMDDADKDKSHQCFFVDFGDVNVVRSTCIYDLHREYAREPAQAFHCRLDGLEDLYEISTHCDPILELEGIDVTLEVSETNDEDKILYVIMYDSEGSSLNEELLRDIWLDAAKPSLEVNIPVDVHVSHIGNNGTFYVQIRNEGYAKLMSILEELETKLPTLVSKLNKKESITRENSNGKLYYAKVGGDKHHHRVRIIDSPANFQFAQILYVDTGRTCVIKLADVKLHPLEALSQEANTFPEQALLVKLDIDAIPADFATKMQEMVPKDVSVLLRTVKIDDTDKIPLVKLFVRHPNIGLVSVSDSLAMEEYNSESPPPPLNSPTLPNSPHRISPPESPQNVPSTGCLPEPRLPLVGQFYEVSVPFAVNPWNFIVQPLDSEGHLADLMQKLKRTYDRKPPAEPIGLADLKAGHIYAAKYKKTSNAWYRVCVLKIIPSAIIVFYVDYGYYGNLSHSELFALDEEFQQLPHQAIKAKLAGIKPKQEKWSVEDCKYFQKLVMKRDYVSVIMSIEQDELYPSDKVLQLKLVDTTTQQDVHIGDLLIQKKIAVRDG